MFLHKPLNKIELTRIDSPDGRKYLTPEGKHYESVTTWLGRIKDDTWIKEWKDRVGEKEADKITKRASNRGTRLHESVERYINNESVDIAEMHMFDKILFEPFTKVLDEHVNHIKALEYKLYSNTLKLAGTVDCVAEFDNVLSIIDFKTSKNKKDKEDIDSYFLQTSIYSYMIEELYGIKIDKLVIIMSLDYEGKVQIFEESRRRWSKKLVSLIKTYPPK